MALALNKLTKVDIPLHKETKKIHQFSYKYIVEYYSSVSGVLGFVA